MEEEALYALQDVVLVYLRFEVKHLNSLPVLHDECGSTPSGPCLQVPESDRSSVWSDLECFAGINIFCVSVYVCGRASASVWAWFACTRKITETRAKQTKIFTKLNLVQPSAGPICSNSFNFPSHFVSALKHFSPGFPLLLFPLYFSVVTKVLCLLMTWARSNFDCIFILIYLPGICLDFFEDLSMDFFFWLSRIFAVSFS